MSLDNMLEKLTHEKCEESFNRWRLNVLAQTINAPEGLAEKLESFCQSNKHLFFRDFKRKKQDELRIAIEKALNPIQIKVSHGKFNDTKERIFLEAYFRHQGNIRQAAESIGVAKSTYHDWISEHRELIESEKNKSL